MQSCHPVDSSSTFKSPCVGSSAATQVILPVTLKVPCHQSDLLPTAKTTAKIKKALIYKKEERISAHKKPSQAVMCVQLMHKGLCSYSQEITMMVGQEKIHFC